MGVCDLIPGISGGTIAFITGIYERLINAIKGFSPRLITGDFKKEVKKLDLGFLVVLFAGIILSILLGSRVIDSLLQNHYAKTLSFFIGLIVASSFIIFKSIKNHEKSRFFKKDFEAFSSGKEHQSKSSIIKHDVGDYIFGLVGLAIGIALVFLSPASISVSTGYLFLGGFVSISAMFLPGISGSFILLIMGLYEPVIGMLSDIVGNWKSLLVFIIGMIFGAFFISRVISYLFRKDKNKTLYFLLGLVVGSLGVPIMRVYEVGSLNPWLLIIGAILVLVVGRYSKN